MKKIFVHLHLYYKEQADMFAEKISSALNGHDFSYDLFITINEHNDEIEQKILSFKPDAKFIIVKNIGADIFPFITVLNLVDLNDYDYLIKLHTKKLYDDLRLEKKDNTFHRQDRFTYFEFKFWNDYLTAFLTFENMKKILIRFEQDKKLGMVAEHRIILKENPIKNKLIYLYPAGTGREVVFPAGTMFIARAHIFDSVKQMNLDESKFSMYKNPIDKSNFSKHEKLDGFLSSYERFLWGMERFIGNCANAQGLKIEDVFTPKSQIIYWKFIAFLKYYIRKISRFFYRRQKGWIKICKIPIMTVSKNR